MTWRKQNPDDLQARLKVLAFTAFVFCCLCVLWAFRAQNAADTADAALKQSQQQAVLIVSNQLAECRRVQVVREQLNGVSQIVHDVLQSAGEQILTTHSPAVPRGSRRVIREVRHTGRIYLRYQARLKFHPPTNCTVALAKGTKYSRPPDRPFPSVR